MSDYPSSTLDSSLVLAYYLYPLSLDHRHDGIKTRQDNAQQMGVVHCLRIGILPIVLRQVRCLPSSNTSYSLPSVVMPLNCPSARDTQRTMKKTHRYPRCAYPDKSEEWTLSGDDYFLHIVRLKSSRRIRHSYTSRFCI